MKTRDVSSILLMPPSKIVPDDYAILPHTEMAKRETPGERLRAARRALGLGADKLSLNIERDHRAEVGASTIRAIETGRIVNPGVKTLEIMARGLGLEPQEVTAFYLDDPPDAPETGYTESQFALIAKNYKQVRKDKKAVVDELIKLVAEYINKSR